MQIVSMVVLAIIVLMLLGACTAQAQSSIAILAGAGAFVVVFLGSIALGAIWVFCKIFK